MRPALLLALVLPLTACAATKDYLMRFRGDGQLNPNSAGQPNPVKVKVVKLKAGGVATFQGADFDALWSNAKDVLKEDMVGTPDELFLAPNSTPEPLRLLNVADDVTHFGVVVNFNRLEQGKERLLLKRDEVPNLELWLHHHVIESRAPGSAAATQPDRRPQGS